MPYEALMRRGGSEKVEKYDVIGEKEDQTPSDDDRRRGRIDFLQKCDIIFERPLNNSTRIPPRITSLARLVRPLSPPIGAGVVRGLKF